MWFKKLILFLIHLYSIAVSPFLGTRCRFYPSCSSYCSEAIRQLSFLRALKLSVFRLLKCHPWNPGGIDRVPVK